MDSRPTWEEIDRLGKSYAEKSHEQLRRRDLRLDALEEDVAGLTETLKWISRLVIGAVLAALLAVVLGVPPAL